MDNDTAFACVVQDAPSCRVISTEFEQKCLAQNLCPECATEGYSSQLVREGGCMVCPSCGWSLCG